MRELLGEDIRADQLNDHTLGKALDEIAFYGGTRFFGEIAMEIATEESLFGKAVHLDTHQFFSQRTVR